MLTVIDGVVARGAGPGNEGEGFMVSTKAVARGGAAPAMFMTGGMVCFAVAGVLAATPASAGKGGAPPGDNGTIKIDGISFDGGKANHPHVSCPFQVSLWGFDNVTDQATVSFEAQAPSKTTHGSDPQAVPVTSGATSFTFTGTGNEQDLDHIETYTLDTSALNKHPIQGYHIKVTVTVTSPTSSALSPALSPQKPNGNNGNNGNGGNAANGNNANNANNGNGNDGNNGNSNGNNNGNSNGNNGNNGNDGNNGNSNGNNGNGNGHGNQGTTTKYKVFWMSDCPGPSVSTPSPTPSQTTATTTVGGTTGGSTNTPETVNPTPSVSPTTSVLGEKVTRKPTTGSKPPTTKVKAVQVAKLPFTGLPANVLRVLLPAALGFILTGWGLVGAGRRTRGRLQT